MIHIPKHDARFLPCSVARSEKSAERAEDTFSPPQLRPSSSMLSKHDTAGANHFFLLRCPSPGLMWWVLCCCCLVGRPVVFWSVWVSFGTISLTLNITRLPFVTDLMTSSAMPRTSVVSRLTNNDVVAKTTYLSQTTKIIIMKLCNNFGDSLSRRRLPSSHFLNQPDFRAHFSC